MSFSAIVPPRDPRPVAALLLDQSMTSRFGSKTKVNFDSSKQIVYVWCMWAIIIMRPYNETLIIMLYRLFTNFAAATLKPR